MALSIPPQTNIILIGQAPNRAPYTILFDLLSEALEKNEITLSCVNTQATGTMRLSDHAPSNTFTFTTNSPIEMLNSNQFELTPALAFGAIVPDESKISSIEDLYVLSNSMANPLIILLPWSYDPAWYVGGYNAQYASSFHAPCHDQKAIEVVEELFPGAPKHMLSDSELTPEFESQMRNMLLPADDKSCTFHYKFPEKVGLQFNIDQLEKIIVGNTRKGLEHYRPATAADYSAAEQAQIDELIDTRNGLGKEIERLRELERGLKISIADLADTKEAKLEELRVEALRFHQEWEAIHNATTIASMREIGELAAQTEADRASLKDGMDAYFELKAKFTPTVDKRILKIEDRIQKVLDSMQMVRTAMAQEKIRAGKLESIRRNSTGPLLEIFEEFSKDFLIQFKQKANPNINIYDMTLIALCQFALIELDPKPNESLRVSDYRIHQYQVWQHFAQAAKNATEDEAHWFDQTVDAFPDHVKMHFKSAFTAFQMPHDPRSWITAKDIWQNLLDTANSVLPLSAADEIEQAALANGAGIKDSKAIEAEAIEVNEVSEVRQLGE